MAKKTLQKSDTLPTEHTVVTLVNLPRVKIDLIRETSTDENDREVRFLLRKIKYFAPFNVQGFEIKLRENEARILLTALQGQLNTGQEQQPWNRDRDRPNQTGYFETEREKKAS